MLTCWERQRAQEEGNNKEKHKHWGARPGCCGIGTGLEATWLAAPDPPEALTAAQHTSAAKQTLPEPRGSRPFLSRLQAFNAPAAPAAAPNPSSAKRDVYAETTTLGQCVDLAACAFCRCPSFACLILTWSPCEMCIPLGAWNRSVTRTKRNTVRESVLVRSLSGST